MFALRTLLIHRSSSSWGSQHEPRCFASASGMSSPGFPSGGFRVASVQEDIWLPLLWARWQKIFMIPLWSKMAVFWNKMFLTIIVLLIVLFLDAVREVRKYSAVHVNEKAANINTNAFDHIQMKLFRSQRNLYLSGFSLFLWLVLRRTITLLTQLAKGMASHAALETQVNDATEAAKKYMAENERLQEALSEKGSSKSKESAEATDKKLKKEVEHLKAELQKTSDALQKANNEVTAVKKQSEGLRREYDHLMKEYEQLQDGLNEAEDKKDL